MTTQKSIEGNQLAALTHPIQRDVRLANPPAFILVAMEDGVLNDENNQAFRVIRFCALCKTSRDSAEG